MLLAVAMPRMEKEIKRSGDMEVLDDYRSRCDTQTKRFEQVFDFLEVSNIPRKGDGQFLLKVCFRITTFQTGRFFKRVLNVSHRVTHDITYFGSCYLYCAALRQFRTKNERWAMRAEAAHQWRQFKGRERSMNLKQDIP